MVCRDELIRKLDPEDRHFIDRCQLIAVCVFLAIYIAIIVWWVFAGAGDAAGDRPQLPGSAVESATVHATVEDAPHAP
jgi:hypothetical protein